MEKVLIVGCKRTMGEACVACSRCMVGFNRREGEFSRYAGEEAELIGLLHCGDCPGAAIVPRLALISLWNKPMNEKVTKVHVAPCIVDHCEYRETLLEKIEAKAGVEIPEHEQIRVATLVKQALESRAPGRFVFVKEVKKASKMAPTSGEPGPQAPKTVLMHILFTEYDQGDAFARFMIAGAGQIRIGTDVALRDQATDELLGRYEVSKQFAFGGIYGASTDMEDVEEGLALGIADNLVPETSAR